MSTLGDNLLQLVTTLGRDESLRARDRQPIVAYGLLRDGGRGTRDEDRWYLCAGNGACLELATRRDERMPLTQRDLNVESILYPDGPIRCAHCGTELTVHGPDPRD